MFRFIPPLLTFLIFSITSTQALTVIVDFNDPTQGTTSTFFNGGGSAPTVDTFDITDFGFADTIANRSLIENSIMAELQNDFYGIPTLATDPMSPIPPGMQLNIDFEIGDFGTLPANGDTEFYYVQVGDHVSGDFGGSLGVAGLNSMRSATGSPSITGRMVGSIHTDTISTLSGVGALLSSGNLSATTHAINGTLAHEIGHALSLRHLDKAGSDTYSNLPPLMATGAVDLPNADRVADRDFAWSGFNAQEGGVAQFHVLQLVGAIGLRADTVAVPEPSTALPLLLLGLVCLRRLQR